MEKIVGILGGMGPEATSDLFKKVIDRTSANSDQEHIRMIIENNVKIPDRTSYILNKEGVNPLKHLIKSAVRLEILGADLIAIPCNTAHYFYDEIKEFLDVELLNMIDEVGKFICKSFGSKKEVGLLATKGTYAGNIYEKYFQPYGIKIIRPTDEVQMDLLTLIYDVKRGKKDNYELIEKVLMEFKSQNITTLVLGCTELPLIFNSSIESDLSKEFTFVESTNILAQKIVEVAKGL